MSHIFLSYASEDRERVRPLAEALSRAVHALGVQSYTETESETLGQKAWQTIPLAFSLQAPVI